MAREIERKFLVNRDAWHPDRARGIPIRQGYLSDQAARTVRIRIGGGDAFLTIKGLTVGAERQEYEYAIPLPDANLILDTLCLKPLIEKTRYRVEHAGRVWDVDEFAGENRGLVVAEVELPSADADVVLPEWAGAEVTNDPRYFNANLVRHPFVAW